MKRKDILIAKLKAKQKIREVMAVHQQNFAPPQPPQQQQPPQQSPQESQNAGTQPQPPEATPPDQPI